MPTPTDTVLRFFDVLRAQRSAEDLAALLDDALVSEELPNRLLPQGHTRDKAAMLAGFERGRSYVGDQTYTITQIVSEGDTVVVAFTWTGRVLVSAGPFQAGTALRAQCLGVFEVQRGRVVRHRTYDCYDPW